MVTGARRRVPDDGLALLGVRRVEKSYRRGGENTPALRGVDLELYAGGLTVLSGPSGCGKSTLLAVLCGWERPDAGELRLSATLGARDPARLGWSDLALVPQALGLIEELTVAQNVGVARRLAGRPVTAQHADALARDLDVADLGARHPGETSLGQQQRVAVLRTLVADPRILLADEPSTHQDADRAYAVFQLLRKAADGGAAVLVTSHDPEALRWADTVLQIRDGVIDDTGGA